MDNIDTENGNARVELSSLILFLFVLNTVFPVLFSEGLFYII